MSKSSAVFMWVAAILLIGVYLFPLWTIDLQAPQYPQGLGIHIWISKITGREKHDLQNINGLNHYIGMKAIEPDAIPELRYMKYINGFLILFAAAVALLRRRWLLAVFVLVAVGLAAIGMYDFWKWEYQYGHDLDPSAAIKVPGMSYQPPLFGTKQLLNFTTTAWPGLGGICAMLAVGLSVLALIKEFLLRARKTRGTASLAIIGTTAFALIVSATGCAKKPQPIEYGSDACDFCRMTIADQRYGAEAITKKGRAYKYDSIECLAMAVNDGDDLSVGQIHGYYVTDFSRPGTLIDAGTASFLHSEALPSPMGMNLTGFADRADAETIRADRSGTVLDWPEVLVLVTQDKERHSEGR